MVSNIESQLYGYAKLDIPDALKLNIVSTDRKYPITRLVIKLIPYDSAMSHIESVINQGHMLNSVVYKMGVYELIPPTKYGVFCRSTEYTLDGNKVFGDYAGGVNERGEVLSPDMVSLGIGMCLEEGDEFTPETLIGVTSVISDYIIRLGLDVDPMEFIQSYVSIIPFISDAEKSSQYENILYISKLKYLVKRLILEPDSYPGGFLRESD